MICMTAIAAALSVASATALANVSPTAPAITEPATDGQIVNPEDVHMECSNFSDADPGDTHACTDWEIWTVGSPGELVWRIQCIGGVERLHTHLGDGAFMGSHVGRSSMLPGVNYLLRCRHKDSSGEAATQWSLWGGRFFTTGPASAVFPLQLDDVAASPTPALTDAFGSPLVFPGGGPLAPALRLEGADGDLLLEIRGDDGSSNQIINPPGLADHVAARIRATAVSGGSELLIPESAWSFYDDHGDLHTVYLPAINLVPGQEAIYWVSSFGGTYLGLPGQTQPSFSTLARSPPVPWVSAQPGYKVDVIAGGFQLPVNIAFIPNAGPDPEDPIFYVTELYGTIKVVRRNGTVSNYATNLLNFSPTGLFPGSGEQGLAGIAVDAATGDVFAGMLYDSAPPNGAHYPKVVRFQSNDGGLTAATQTTILNMVGETQGQSHQISNFSFGPDGKLYVHMGDGFTTATAQNLASYRGKILRMNLNGSAPTDNPFYNAADGINSRDYVFAYGFRNPFGGAWRAEDGFHYEIENGPSVDRLAKVIAGTNYLWSGSDASMANSAIYNWNPSRGPVNGAFIQPETFGGSAFPVDKFGHLFVSESGPTWGTGAQPLGKRIVEFVLNAAGGVVSGPTPLIEYNGPGKATCVGLAAGPDGLYFTDLYKDVGYSSPIDVGGQVLRVRFVGTANFTADVTTGAAPLAVHFTDTSNAPAPTAWHWKFGDGSTSNQQHPTHVYAHEGVYNVRLAVTAANGLVVEQKNAFIRVGETPAIAIIGGSMPPSAADAAVANHLRERGFSATSFDDEPANRPSAAQLGAQFDLVVVSSTITAGNVAGQFRTVNVPLVFWENALLQTAREALADSGSTVDAVSSINVLNNSHPITQGLATGPLAVFDPAATMSVGRGTVAGGATLLATRNGVAADYSILTADAGAVLLGGYVAPEKRVFVFFQDSSWLNATDPAEQILNQAVCWAMGSGSPLVAGPGSQSVLAGESLTLTATVTSTPPAAMQWRRNGIDLFDGGRITGATSPALTINPVVASDAGSYDLVAFSPCGQTAGIATTLTVRSRGDTNCDGAVNDADISPFVLALIDSAAYAAQFPGCSIVVCDMNLDATVDGGDVTGFAAALLE